MRIEEQGFEFDAATMQQCDTNYEKWGHQSLDTLFKVLLEEIGEIAKSDLEAEGVERYRQEIIDASSVLRRMYMHAEELCENDSSDG